MFELEAHKLREALTLIRNMRGARAEKARAISSKVADTLDGHDCSEYADECVNCEWREDHTDKVDLPDVSECLALGLPLLIAMYGYSSVEVCTAEQAISDLS